MLSSQRRVTKPKIRSLSSISLSDLLSSLVRLHPFADEKEIREDEDVSSVVVNLLACRGGGEEDLDVERPTKFPGEGKSGRSDLETDFLLEGKRIGERSREVRNRREGLSERQKRDVNEPWGSS